MVVFRRRMWSEIFSTEVCPLKLSKIRRTFRSETWRSNQKPLQEDDLCHPRGRIVHVYTPKWRDVNVFETPRVLKLANHPQWELVRAIVVATQHQGQALLALFPAFELLCRKGVVCLQCGQRCLVSQGQTHLISFWTYSMYLHAVEQPTLIHVVNVTPFVRVKNLTNSRKGSCNSSHVD